MGAKMVWTHCRFSGCRIPIQVRKADKDRGWGLFCSKSCKAREQAKRDVRSRFGIVRLGPQDFEEASNG